MKIKVSFVINDDDYISIKLTHKIKFNVKNNIDEIKQKDNNISINNLNLSNEYNNNNKQQNISNIYHNFLINNIDDIDKLEIITLFYNNVKGIEICLDEKYKNHCGKEGYWLETKIGIKHNSKNEPDINGYEMKKYSKKISLGDFSASEYAFSGNNKRNNINLINNWTDENKLSRSEFIKSFGNPNLSKDNRYSWSGSCIPIYNNWNYNGTILKISENNDIIIYYSFSKDTRNNKIDLPIFLQNDNIIIALWEEKKMKKHINTKFNKKGFFMCKKIENKYENICFGKSFNFDYFIECIKNKKIFFDSGMYDGNSRNYSQFRGKCFWEELIIEEY
jgi:hypothetical protein